MEKKVLIITYYWPPSGGSGVQRWLKFVKYLPQVGWTPFVFTPENPTFDIQDQSLLADVPEEAEIIRFPIWEPYSIFFKLSAMLGSKKTAKPTDLVAGKQKSLLQTISSWIRGNFFIPDPRIFWVRPSVRFLHDFLIEHKINTIITTGPPHSLHLIGLRLKKKNQAIKWIADFRDPWSDWGLLDSLMVGRLARKRHRQLERQVLRSADEVLTITPFYVRRFTQLSGREVRLLTNGYDAHDFENLCIQRTEKFMIRHVGTVNEKCNPRPFMEAARQLAQSSELFRSLVSVNFVGDVHPQFKAFVQSSSEMSAFTSFTPQIPHRDLITLYGQSALLLIVLTGYKDAEGYMPGKLFEYLATGLPIVGTGPESGDAALLLSESGAGVMIDDQRTEKIKEVLWRHFQSWQTGKTPLLENAEKKYSRIELTKTLTGWLEASAAP